MTTFVLRILFTGLMAFIPNENGTEVTVLLLNADHYHTTDGPAMPPHDSILYVRPGSCSGDCINDDLTIARKTFRDQPDAVALDSLPYALGDGSAWLIAGADISVEKSSGEANLPALNIRDDVRGTVEGQPQVIPTTATERKDFSWIARLAQSCSSGCTLDSDLFDTVPSDIVAARFKINSGDLYTYSIARLGSNVTPVHFKRLDGTGSTSSYTQAVASWVGVDIEVTGDSVQLVESKYTGGGRSMTLAPDSNGLVEMAVVNLPPFIPPASPNNDAPQPGKHFEMFYELLENPPARAARQVPFAGAPAGTTVPEVTWSSVHPTTTTTSELLNRLRMEPGRSFYDRTICPPVNLP